MGHRGQPSRLKVKKYCHPEVPIAFTVFQKIGFKREQEVSTLLPTIVFDHVSKLNDKFSFLIFLTAFKGMFIFPPKCGLAVLAVDVRHGVQAGEKDPLLRRAATHIHHRIEEVGSALTPLKGLQRKRGF